MATSQLNLDSLNAGRRSGNCTAQRQFLTSKNGHLTAQQVASIFSMAEFKLWGGFPFEILRLPRFVHRNCNLPCSATTAGTTRSPSVILATQERKYSQGPFMASLFLLVFWILFWGP